MNLAGLGSDLVIFIFMISVFSILLSGPLALIIDGLRIGIKSIELYKNNKTQNIKNKKSTIVKAIIFLTAAVTNILGLTGAIVCTFHLYKTPPAFFYYLNFLYPIFFIELPALVIYEEIIIQKQITKNKTKRNKIKTIILRIISILIATLIIASEILLLIFIFLIAPNV